MHLDFIGSFIFVADRSWIWLAAYCFVLASAYSGYTLFAGKFMAPRLTFGLVVAGFVCQTIFLGVRGHEVGRCPITNFFELLTFLRWSMILIECPNAGLWTRRTVKGAARSQLRQRSQTLLPAS